jgi:hypothetical protein
MGYLPEWDGMEADIAHLEQLKTESAGAFFVQIPVLSHVSSRVRAGFAAEVLLLSFQSTPRL